VHRQLLGDDEDLAQIRVDPDQLGDTIARGGRRQIHHAAVEDCGNGFNAAPRAARAHQRRHNKHSAGEQP
jgi:hypothetical protein